MTGSSSRWIVLILVLAFATVAGVCMLYVEHSRVGYLLALGGSGGFAAMWIARREATKAALRTILEGIVWFVTGGGF
jgi:hypothetical protein